MSRSISGTTSPISGWSRTFWRPIATQREGPAHGDMHEQDHLHAPPHGEVQPRALFRHGGDGPRCGAPQAASGIGQQDIAGLAVAPEETLYVGDSEVDLKTAEAAGVRFVSYKNKAISTGILINDHRDVLKFLEYSVTHVDRERDLHQRGPHPAVATGRHPPAKGPRSGPASPRGSAGIFRQTDNKILTDCFPRLNLGLN